MDYSEIKQLYSVEDVNQHLAEGWVFVSAHTNIPSDQNVRIPIPRVPAFFIIGKPKQ